MESLGGEWGPTANQCDVFPVHSFGHLWPVNALDIHFTEPGCEGIARVYIFHPEKIECQQDLPPEAITKEVIGRMGFPRSVKTKT